MVLVSYSGKDKISIPQQALTSLSREGVVLKINPVSWEVYH